ncbi:alpha/beta hydrolase [Hanstruepera marina]|uniref:alpha/beta hydrolase n=1 Tax=Hanstruepera marina TaxID=2873265 RepID=UPI001CA6F80E|nr:alpha/beta hydrolase-fold protein [Hanstruepera marina]
MRLKLLFVGILVVINTSCESQKSIKSLKSEFLTDSIYSESLAEYRKHNVYLPKGFSKEEKYPIIYATDGNSNLTNKKELLDSLINNQIIKPVIFVASFSNNKIADSTSTKLGEKRVYLTYRNFEYVDRKPKRKEDSLLVNRFQDHMSYFTTELIPAIESKYNQPNEKENRLFYGVSNGAGFGLSLLNNKPDLIGTYLCFSIFGGDIQSNHWYAETKYPDLYLRYGSEEPFFLKEDANFLQSQYAESHALIEVKEFNGGHSDVYWNTEFIETITRLLQ